MMKSSMIILAVAMSIISMVACEGKSGGLSPSFPPPPPPSHAFPKSGYVPAQHFDPNRQQVPGGPIGDPSFGLMNIFNLLLPIVVIVGVGLLVLPLIMGVLGGPGPFPYHMKKRAEEAMGMPFTKENIMELLTTVGNAIEKVDKALKKKE